MPKANDILMEDILTGNAVYWKRTGVDDFNNDTYATPEPIACRWEHVNEAYIDRAGKTTVSKSKILVDRDMEIDDVLWEGKFSLLKHPDDPFKNNGAEEVQSFNKVPNVDGDEFLRTVFA